MSRLSKRTRNTLVFAASALVWLVVDRLTKALADVGAPGTVLWPGIPGVFDLQLVHNTGAAWGLFAGNPAALGWVALVICAVVLVGGHLRRSTASVPEMLGYALILAGGAGNAIDRFTNGYVVDFFNFDLIGFPVFNVADIGVVVGFVLVAIVLLALGAHEGVRAGEHAGEREDVRKGETAVAHETQADTRTDA